MNSLTKRSAYMMYGIFCYMAFFVTFIYLIGFLGNIMVPKSIDGTPKMDIGPALLINFALIMIFAMQHSVMARPGFKEWWTRIVPKPLERATYCLATSVALVMLFAFWQPMGGMVWNATDPVARGILYALFAMGWVIIFAATCMINHFDLFGLRQAWLYFRGREYTPLKLDTPVAYKFVRHPLYIGWFTAIWATPTMSVTHLAFAIMTTVYILIAVQFEERDLILEHGDDYVEYRRTTPAFIPFTKRADRTTMTTETNQA